MGDRGTLTTALAVRRCWLELLEFAVSVEESVLLRADVAALCTVLFDEFGKTGDGFSSTGVYGGGGKGLLIFTGITIVVGGACEALRFKLPCWLGGVWTMRDGTRRGLLRV